MAFKISTTCSKCGKGPPEVTSFSVISMDEVVCFLCKPPPLEALEGPCPTCDGYGQVQLFEAWAMLNQIPFETLSPFKALGGFFKNCRTKVAARKALAYLCLLDRYPFLPDWLPEA